jgi:hypothetical protein
MALNSKFKRHSANCKYNEEHKKVDDYDRRNWGCDCIFTVHGEFYFQSANGEIVFKSARRTTGESQEDRADAVIQAALKRGFWVDVALTTKKLGVRLKALQSELNKGFEELRKDTVVAGCLDALISKSMRNPRLIETVAKMATLLGERDAVLAALAQISQTESSKHLN